MKNLLLLLMMMSGLWCCQKEDSITPELKPENLYAVENNTSDPIRQRVYDIYDQYKVTVVFNDTIGKVFVKTDVHGDSVFTYERIDPAYSFTGYNNLDYEYSFLTDPAAQNQLLDVVEEYLSSCNKNLYPQVILLTNSYSKTDQRGTTDVIADGKFDITYRSLLLSYTSDEDVLESLANEIMKTFIIQRIADYSAEAQSFHQVSKDFIGKSWGVLGVSDLKEPITYVDDYWGVEVTVTKFSNGPLYSSCSCLQDDWWGLRDYDAELVEIFRNAVRQLIGPFGFVMQSAKDPVGAPPFG